MPVMATLFGSRTTDVAAARWLELMAPQDRSAELGQGYNQFDLRGRIVELVRDTLAAVRLAEGPRPRASVDDAIMESQHHGGINHTVPGQNAKSDAPFAGAGRTSRESQLTSLDPESSEDTEETPSRSAVGRLVAFDEATGVWAAVWSLGSRLVGGGDDDGYGSAASHDLLAPRFAFDPATLFDPAALGAAIGDLLSEADELGTSLLGFLTDPTPSADLALVAGVAAAGFAYRHWRSGPSREEAEARAMLAARFVTGPSSLRLGRRISP
jgi:hypothetical protein